MTAVVECQWTRTLGEFFEGSSLDEAPTKQELLDDALALALGEDTGCLGEEELADHVEVMWLQGKLTELLAAAKSRIRDLEQERGAEGTNWFPESFVSQLQTQVVAVTQERDTLKSDVAVFQGSTFASKRDLASKIAHLQVHNKRLRDALLAVRDGGNFHAAPRLRKQIDAALAEEEKPA